MAPPSPVELPVLPFRALVEIEEALADALDVNPDLVVFVLDGRGGEGRGAAKDRAEVRVDCFSGEVERRTALPLPLADDVDNVAVEEEVGLGFELDDEGLADGLEEAEDAEDLGTEELDGLVIDDERGG
jgi:hypothetical protein